MAAVGTWSFSRPAVERMSCMLLAGQNATDVVETAMAGNRQLLYSSSSIKYFTFYYLKGINTYK